MTATQDTIRSGITPLGQHLLDARNYEFEDQTNPGPIGSMVLLILAITALASVFFLFIEWNSQEGFNLGSLIVPLACGGFMLFLLLASKYAEHYYTLSLDIAARTLTITRTDTATEPKPTEIIDFDDLVLCFYYSAGTDGGPSSFTIDLRRKDYLKKDDGRRGRNDCFLYNLSHGEGASDVKKIVRPIFIEMVVRSGIAGDDATGR